MRDLGSTRKSAFEGFQKTHKENIPGKLLKNYWHLGDAVRAEFTAPRKKKAEAIV